MSFAKSVNTLPFAFALSACILVSSAHADFNSFDNRGDFDAAAPGADLIDFSFTGTALEVTGSGHLLQPDPFAIPNTDIEVRGVSDSLFLLGPDFTVGSIVNLTLNGPYNTADGTTYLKSGFEAEFTFGPGGTNVFGIDVFSLLDPPSPLAVEVFVESVGGTTLFEDEFDMDSFVGFVSDDAIGTITFALVGPVSEGQAALGFDNMSFGSALTGVVPAPAAAALALTGFGTLTLFRRHRREDA